MYMYMPLLPVYELWKSMTDKNLGMRSECKHILNAADIFNCNLINYFHSGIDATPMECFSLNVVLQSYRKQV